MRACTWTDGSLFFHKESGEIYHTLSVAQYKMHRAGRNAYNSRFDHGLLLVECPDKIKRIIPHCTLYFTTAEEQLSWAKALKEAGALGTGDMVGSASRLRLTSPAEAASVGGDVCFCGKCGTGFCVSSGNAL